MHESVFKDKIKFTNFDFHHYCGGDKYQALKVLVKKVDTDLLRQGYLVEDMGTRSVESLQTGVFRTNCLDSLDRTNVAQSKLGMVILQIMLQRLGFDLERFFGREFKVHGIAFMYEDDETSVI